MTPVEWAQTVPWHDAGVDAVRHDARAGALELDLEIGETAYRLRFDEARDVRATPALETLEWSAGFDGEILGVRFVPEDSGRYRIRFTIQTFDYALRRRDMLVLDANVCTLSWSRRHPRDPSTR